MAHLHLRPISEATLSLIPSQCGPLPVAKKETWRRLLFPSGFISVVAIRDQGDEGHHDSSRQIRVRVVLRESVERQRLGEGRGRLISVVAIRDQGDEGHNGEVKEGKRISMTCRLG